MTNNQKQDVVEIDLLELANVLLRRIGIIILCTVLVAAMAFGYTYCYITPTYTASVMMYVNNSDISIGSTSISVSSSDLSVSQNLVSTYAIIAKTRTTLEDVIESENLSYSYGQLYNMITVESVSSTAIFKIKVTSTSPTEAKQIANAIAEILPEKLASIVGGSDARIVDYAVTPSTRTSPNYTKNTAVGALVGFLIAAAFIVVRHLFDENIHGEDYLNRTFSKIPLMAVVPDMTISSKMSKYSYYGKKRPASLKEPKRPAKKEDSNHG